MKISSGVLMAAVLPAGYALFEMLKRYQAVERDRWADTALGVLSGSDTFSSAEEAAAAQATQAFAGALGNLITEIRAARAPTPPRPSPAPLGGPKGPFQGARVN